MTCDGDAQKYVEWLMQNKSYGEKKAINQAMEAVFNSTKLSNLLNNQIKEPMTLWRCETKLHLGDNPQVGQIITFKGFNSTAITKEGMQYFEKTSNKSIKAYIEIEAPIGTRGAYISPLAPSKYMPEMEFLLQKDTNVEILELGKMGKYDYAKLKVVNQYNFDEVLNPNDIGLKLL